MKQVIILILILPFVVFILLPASICSDLVLYWLIGCCYSVLPIVICMKITNTRLLKPIANSFPGRFSVLSQSFKGNYKNQEFIISFEGGRPAIKIYFWKLALLLNPGINFDAYIYSNNPGPVLFKKRLGGLQHKEDSLYVFSSHPEDAKYFMQDANNLKLIREIKETTIPETAKKFFNNRLSLSLSSLFVFKKNQLITTIITPKNDLIDPLLEKKGSIDPQLVQLCLDKMIMLAENLRTAPRF